MVSLGELREQPLGDGPGQGPVKPQRGAPLCPLERLRFHRRYFCVSHVMLIRTCNGPSLLGPGLVVSGKVTYATLCSHFVDCFVVHPFES